MHWSVPYHSAGVAHATAVRRGCSFPRRHHWLRPHLLSRVLRGDSAPESTVRLGGGPVATRCPRLRRGAWWASPVRD